MLEISNLTKIYKNKNGMEIVALDNINIKFPKTGMIFLLGKSGSGKSTLLNICGGLDVATSGEIKVNGRSSLEFKNSDFDSYRNTYVGFIFQEYNILNEFTVEENISLALELQGKSNDKNKVNELLNMVDLDGYNKRKVNTLSGGQKQRIAIARALIKNPKIILADEPTGALDSYTGIQVLETLKKLSKNTLVIVVSHDREFALNYADRIIELKDGHIISDRSKSSQSEKKLSENISAYNNILCIKNSKNLNNIDLNYINSFIKNSDTEILISNNPKELNEFKKVVHISEDGNKESFCETKNVNIENNDLDNVKFIKSSLPFKHAFKIGVSSIKAKPIRLFFIIILCIFAFTFFGIFSTMTFYNSKRTFLKSIELSNMKDLKLGKTYEINQISYSNNEKDNFKFYNSAKFNDAELDKIKSKFNNDSFGVINVNMLINTQNNNEYWKSEINSLATISENNKISKNILGKLPSKDNEIVLSSYLVDSIINNKGYDSSGNEININSRNEIIGKNLLIGSNVYKVCGVIDSGNIPNKFDALKTNKYDYKLSQKYYEMLKNSSHLFAYVTKNKLKDISSKNSFNYEPSNFEFHDMAKKNEQGIYEKFSSYNYQSINITNYNDNIWFYEDKKINNNDAIVSLDLLVELMINKYNSILKTLDDYIEIEKYYRKINQGYAIRDNNYEIYDNNGDKIIVSETIKKKYINELISDAKSEKITLSCKLLENNNIISDEYVFNIVGIWNPSNKTNMNSKLIVNDDKYNELWKIQSEKLKYYNQYEIKYKKTGDEIYDNIQIPYDYKLKNFYYDLYKNKKENIDYSIYTLTGPFFENLKSIDNTIEEMSKIFLIVGIVIGIFAILLFANFISISINQKIKEIGILRAVGARGKDLYKIFLSESFIISSICSIISIILIFIVCNIINNIVINIINMPIFVFGIPSIISIILLSALTAIIATFLPVNKASRKKPVECIRL